MCWLSCLSANSEQQLLSTRASFRGSLNARSAFHPDVFWIKAKKKEEEAKAKKREEQDKKIKEEAEKKKKAAEDKKLISMGIPIK